MIKTLHFRKILLVAFTVFGFSFLNAQEINRELGIRFSSLNNFDFIYKKQKEANKYIRHRVTLANLRYESLSIDDRVDVDLAYSVGVEKRKDIAEKLQFIHGFEPFASVSLRVLGEAEAFFQVGVGYVLGFQYAVSDKFHLSIETIPRLAFNFNTLETDSDFVANAGFDQNAAAISLVYRFQSAKK